ncbi:hypothetical protein Dsin_011833 [Dipteronia sinensis]|uniref:Protein N-terminal glutamine amidohydrolase n=1 Tax=Dipteronia sinensis TaxID=43782 RepID=A0AAE0AHC9_9ROSI|nr:hypothetical protein Dsin_011833 [Dipteronia sinensis]
MAVSSLDYSSQFDHTPFYCEENVYFLSKKFCANGIAEADGSDHYVVFISNEKKQAYPAGNWIAEPPSYEPIVAEDKNMHNLNEYIKIRAEDISINVGAELINDVSNKILGVAMNENQLEEFFSHNKILGVAISLGLIKTHNTV